MHIEHSPRFLRQLKRHEGLRLKAYICPAGALTIGYGHNLDANPVDWLGGRRTINDAEADRLLRDDLARLLPGVVDITGGRVWGALAPPRQGVLLNMAYNLGLRGLAGFGRMLGAVENSDWQRAADEMLESAWAGQVRGRAFELARQMQTGEWQEGQGHVLHPQS